jgi:hypothetical protein
MDSGRAKEAFNWQPQIQVGQILEEIAAPLKGA